MTTWPINSKPGEAIYIETPLASIYMGDEDTMTQEEWAEVHLIAAAPDLLEACKMAKKHIQHRLSCPICQAQKRCDEEFRLWAKAGDMRDAAILKAEGKS